MATWYIDIDFTPEKPLSLELMIDACEVLREYSAVGTCARDGRSAGISVAIDAVDALATRWAIDAVLQRITPLVGVVTVTKLIVTDEATRQRENDEPTFPEMMTTAGVAKRLGVSRQRASQIARSRIKGFPVPILIVSGVPLYLKAAVESWAASWDRTPGRRSSDTRG